jgi:hypothetical protein
MAKGKHARGRTDRARRAALGLPRERMRYGPRMHEGSARTIGPQPATSGDWRNVGRQDAAQWRSRRLEARSPGGKSAFGTPGNAALRAREQHFWKSGFAKGMGRGVGETLGYSFGLGPIAPGAMANAGTGMHFAGFGVGSSAGSNYWKSTGQYANAGYAADRATGKWKTFKGVGGKLLGPAALAHTAFTTGSAVKAGYEHGGMVGAVGAGAGSAAELGGWAVGIHGAHRGLRAGLGGNLQNIRNAHSAYSSMGGGWTGLKAASSVRQGFWMGKAAGGVNMVRGGLMAAKSNPWTLPAAVALEGLFEIGMEGFTAYENFQKGIQTYHNKVGVPTQGNLAAFMTQGAWTSRQMAVQSIQKSHMNARSAMGNEAQYMHRLGY